MRNLILISLAGALIAATGCRSTEMSAARTTEPPPVPATLVRVQPEPFAASVAVTGTLVSRSHVDVKAETTGRIVRFEKQEGDRVAAGEPVIWVNQENFQLAVRQASSAVGVAEAGLERVKVMEAHSRSEMERARNLVKSGGITDKDLKAAEVTERDARAQVALGEAQLEQARAALEVARKSLRDSTIKAPVAGEIQKKYVNPGAYVEPSTPVFSVVDNGTLELECPVASADLGSIRAGQAVAFTVNSYPGEAMTGRVIDLNPAVEAETRSAKVRVRVENSRGKLKAGMFAEGEIRTGTATEAIVIPSQAVYRDDRSAKSSYVFVAEGSKAVKRAVRIGRERDSKLEIIEGLNPGDLLVAEQSIELAEGVRVRARK